MLGWKINPSKLRALREEARLTPAHIADLVICHPNTWHNLERGQQPSAQLAWRICEVLAEQLGRQVNVTDFARPCKRRPRKPKATAATGSGRAAEGSAA